MSINDTQLTDVSDMPLVHQAFHRGLGETRSQLLFIDDGDTARAAHFADYISELLWLLHAHHAGEDELLYPLLVERVPNEAELFARMDAQHSSVESNLRAATTAAATYRDSGSATDAAVLADACEALLALLQTHLTEEEDEVLPIAARAITPEEWGQLPGHTLMAYGGDRDLAAVRPRDRGVPAARARHDSVRPVTHRTHVARGGSAAFAQEMRLIRDDTAWTNRQPSELTTRSSHHPYVPIAG